MSAEFEAFRNRSPELCAQLIEACGSEANAEKVFNEAVAEGVELERQRCVEHLSLGKAAGEQGLAIAVDAIREGDSVAEHLDDYIFASGHGSARVGLLLAAQRVCGQAS